MLLITTSKAQKRLSAHIRARRLNMNLTQAALAGWTLKAKEYGVSKINIDLIGKKITEHN